MATDAAIASVKIQLPDSPDTYGITDQVIGSQLDTTTQTKTILFCLRGIAAKIAPIEDVNESGSDRSLKFHDRLEAMIIDWQKRADAEDTIAGNLLVKLNARLHTAKRTDLIWPEPTT